MSIADKLTQLNNIKTAIKDAINAKGGTAGDDMTQYASAISSIPTGGSSQTYTLTVTNAGTWINSTNTASQGWRSGIQGVGIPSTVDDSTSSVALLKAGTTGTKSKTFSNVSTVMIADSGSFISLYINNVYGEMSSIGICNLKADTTIRLNGYASCLVEGTKISLADGSEKSIESLTYDDELLVWDFDEGRQSTARIAQLQRNQRKGHYNKLVLEDGTVLYTVYNHSWFNVTKNRFTRTMEATDIGDEIMTLDGPKRLVSKEELSDKHVWFYNLITEKCIDCYANGILVGNHFCNIYPIDGMRYAKTSRPANDYATFSQYCTKETFDAFRVSEYDYSGYSQEGIEAEFRYLSLWQYHVIPKDADVFEYHNAYREVRGLESLKG